MKEPPDREDVHGPGTLASPYVFWRYTEGSHNIASTVLASTLHGKENPRTGKLFMVQEPWLAQMSSGDTQRVLTTLPVQY